MLLGVEIWASVLLVFGLHKTTAQIGPNQQTIYINELCAQMKNGEKVSNPFSCNYYYECSNGVAFIMECNAGYYFDKDSQLCLPPNQVVCKANNKYVCTEQQVGSAVAVNGDCQAYYKCTADGPKLLQCLDGRNFNPTTQRCETPSRYPCTSDASTIRGDLKALSICNVVQNGVRFNDPSSCQNWYMCTNNVLAVGACPTNQGFEASTGTCVSNTDCWAQLNRTDSSTTTSAPQTGGACTVYGTTLAITNSCNTFYKCNGQQYILTVCPNDLYYDTVSGSCVSQLNARNNCDRCVDNNLTYVNQYSTLNCKGYIYCSNGVAAGYGQCPRGYYFNQVDGACDYGDTEPEFGCCNPSVYNSTPKKKL